MREIKFRAWDPRFKYMNYRILVGNVTDEENYHAHGMWIEPEKVDYKCEPHWSNFDEHSDIEIMQYIGLTDKNGINIWEGDILKTNSTDYFNLSFTAVVKFGEYLQDGSGGEYNGEPCLGFYYEAVNPKEVDEYGLRLVPEYMVTCSPLGFNNSEVIGNIYEHPHLLEVSTDE